MNAKPIVAIIYFAAGCLAATVLFMSSGTAQTDASNSLSDENIFVRYARAYSQLAKADLDIALDVNKRIGGAYSENTVQRLRNQVEIAKAKLQYELGGDESKKLHDIHLRELEEASKLAELNLSSAIVVNKRLAGTVSELEIRRLRLAAEVAKLAVARGRDPAAVSTPYAHLQWQLDQVRSELLWLQIRADKLAASR
ncbi:MAG: hypothetical protein GXP26_18415 [Planctomycetes bacterium]|nr:hypothetical protein [Planctomycetota bacterium]